jgi:hypothetical protein
MVEQLSSDIARAECCYFNVVSLEVVFNNISPAIFYITAFELSDGRGNLKY